MFQETYEFLSGLQLNQVLSIFFIGITIKFIDDIVDDDIEYYYIKTLGPYVLVLMVLAFMLDKTLPAVLFLAAYCAGMFKDLKVKLPTGLYSYHESILVLFIMFLFFDLKNVLWALSIILAIDLADDVVDRNKDKKTGNKNLALIYGSVEITVLTIIFFTTALMLKLRTSIQAVIIVPIVIKTYKYIIRRIKGV